MVSSIIDSLKLVLSDKYDISDSDYNKLSDILVNQGLSDSAFDYGLVQIMYLMIHYNHRFPISLNFLKELWGYENISYNFISMIGQLLRNRVISLRKVKKETFFKDSNITKGNTESLDADLYVVVYGSKEFNEVFSRFKSILDKGTTSYIEEGVMLNIPKGVLDAVQKTSKLLRNMNIKIEIESYVPDDVLGNRLNLIISQTSRYSFKDSDIQRRANKWIKKVKSIRDVETYIESSTEIFLGVDISDVRNLKELPDSIYGFIEELEMEGV